MLERLRRGGDSDGDGDMAPRSIQGDDVKTGHALHLLQDMNDTLPCPVGICQGGEGAGHDDTTPYSVPPSVQINSWGRHVSEQPYCHDT
jgi:hypothetical protein